MAKDIYDNFQNFKQNYQEIYSDKIWACFEDFNDYLKREYKDVNVVHSKTHPVSVYTNSTNRKIFSLTKRSKNLLHIHLVDRNNGRSNKITNIRSNFHNLKISDLMQVNNKIGFLIQKEELFQLEEVIQIFKAWYN